MKTKNTFLMNINAKSFLLFIVFLVLSLNIQAQYCTATGGCYKYISHVQFSNIDNSSYCDNYSDYTGYTANVEQGYYYLISVNNPNYYSFDNDSCDVWIDWNNDTIFDNLTEYYKLSNNNANNTNYFGYIKVPETASVGDKRMRVRVRSGGIVDPCGYANSNYNYGEVEDYTVNVSASTPMVLGNIYYTQFNGVTVPGNNEVKIGLVKIVTNGGLNPLYLKNINLNSLNSYLNISNANIYFTYNFTDFFNNYPYGNQINSPSNQLLFTDSMTLLPDTNYFWLTYDVSGSATIGAHLKANLESVNINDINQSPTSIDTSGYIEIVTPLSGTYFINAQGNGDYLSFNEAVNDLVLRGVSGPVVFSVDTGTYNEQIVIPSINGVSATNTITFKSTNNDSTSVNLIYTPSNYNDNYTILLQDASYINFQKLTISSGYSSNYSRVIYITDSANNISFTGNRIIGAETYSGYDDNLALICLMLPQGYSSSNISITNNFLLNGSYGILFDGYNTTMYNNFISENIFINQGGFGIYVVNQSGLTISRNYIFSDMYSSFFYGIYCEYGSGNFLINNNGIFSRNFSNIYGIHIHGYNGNVQSSGIVNNFISLRSTSGYSLGISLDDVTLGVYYNSINIIGNNTNTYALYVDNSSGVVLKNNIISNSSNGTAIYGGTCSQCQSDYNDIYSNGIFVKVNGGADIIPNLASWTALTQMDSNSVSVNPQFVSETDLHTSNISLNGRAIPIAGITVDIEGQTRNALTPDIGADEFDPPAYDLQLESFVSIPSGCGLTNNEKIKVIVKNAGTSNYIASNAAIKYQVDIPQQFVSETINRNIASGDTIHYTFTAGANLSVNTFLHDTTFSIQSWIEYINDVNHSNDSISTTLFSQYLHAAPIVSDTIISYGTSVTLTAQVLPDYIPIWYESLTSVSNLKIGNSITSPIMYAPDTVYVSSRKGELDYSIIGNDYNTTSYPFYSYYPDARTQILYTAEELQNAGFVTGNITSLAFNIYSRYATIMNGFNINMQNTSLSNLTAYVETGWTNVFSGTYTVPAIGWQEIIFQNPFVWDGHSNILINICFDNNTYGSTSNVYCSYSQGKTWAGSTSNAVGCSMTGGYSQNYRPNIRFKGTKMGSGCESSRMPLHVGISNTPNKDIGIISVFSPNTGFEVSAPVTVGVIVKNYGASVVDTIPVSYQKADTLLPVTETVIRSLASGDTLHYYFTQKADISTLGTYNFKAYTSLLDDTIYSNDTIYKTIQNFTYCDATFSYGCSYASINSFNINTLTNNNSGCNGITGSHIIYPESSFTTGLQKTIAYPFSIIPGNTYNTGYAIWIDFNHDGDFDDTGEFLYNTYTSSSQISGNITIPSIYSYTGKTRMRVRALRYNHLYSNNSCTSYTSDYGETEDYTITILPEPLQKDVQLISIVKPDNVTYQLVSTDVIVKIKNIGLDTVTQIPLTYIFNAQSPVVYTWNGQLLPQQLIDVNLPQLTATTANNDFTVYTGLAGDMDNTNDTLYRSYIALPAPALISINPDTIFGFIASCDSMATQTLPFSIYNTGWSNLSCNIGFSGIGLVGDTSILVIQESDEWGINMQTFIQTNFGKIATKINSSQIATANFSLYDIIIVTGNQSTSYYNNISNNKTKFETFVNNGGIMQYQLANYNGYTINLVGGVDALSGSNENQNTSLLTTHPIVDGLPITLLGNDANAGYFFNLPSNVNIITETQSSLKPTTIEYTYGNGLVIATTMTWGYLYNNGYNSGPMLPKATAYSMSKVGSFSGWVILSSDSTVIAPNDSSIIDVTLKVGKLNAGTHSQKLVIQSNDPLSPRTKLPVYLTITGAPQIEIRDSIGNFPSIMAGVIATNTFKVYNTGCDSLFITAVNHNDAAFTPIFPSVVSPRDSAIVTVNFNTLIQGLHNDTLTILNNSETRYLYVSGTVLPTPQLVLTPDSFLVNTSNCSDTINYTMLVKNTGNATLNWEAYFSKGAEKALSFNGSNSEVRFGNFGQMPQQGSVEFWMKANSTGYKFLYSSSGLNNWKGVNIYQDYNYLYLIIGNDAGSYYNSYTITNNVDIGNWHHVAVTWDITQNKVWTYFDGNVYSNGGYNPNWPTTISDVRLGIGYSNYYSYYYNGEIDEFRMWSENRTVTDIRNSYKEALVIPTPSLMGLWGFNEASGDTVYSFEEIPKEGLLYNVSRVNSGAKINNPGIDVYPYDGVLNIGDSTNVQVTFITTGLNSGNHYSGIGFTSNDPIHSFVIVPTHLVLTGNPQLQMLTTDLYIDSIMAGASITDSMYFTNTGCDTLKITNITHNNSVFVLNQSLFTVLPNDTVKLKVTFNPINVGVYEDTLQFITNVGNQQLFVHAVAVAAPVASVNPTSFTDTLTTCNQSITKYFKIRNTGNEILSWNGVMGGVGMSDNFDNGINNSNWYSISNGISAASCGTAYGNNALYFGGDGTREAITKSLNTIGGGNVSFYIKISGSGGSPCEQADYGEDVVLEYSINNGSTWSTIQTFYTGNYSYFTAIQTPIPTAAQSFNTRFRWRQLSHSGSCCDHWSIDEININTININNITPSSGTVAVGDSTTVELIVDGQGLINGNYLSQVIINTNDPVHAQITIPVQLVIRANPLVTIANNPFIMDTVMIGAISSDSLYIKNTGCDTLKITNITHVLTEFTVNPLVLTILPKDSAAVNLTFSSLNVGNYIDTLSIFSNTGNINVYVKAKTLGAPEIITLPDQITADFTCDSQLITPFKIKNPGIVSLNWNAFVENQEKGALQFNGINNYVSLGYLSPGTKWTVEAWVNPSVLSYGNKLIAGSAYSSTSWGICMVDSKFAALYTSQNGYGQTLIADNFTVSVGTWYHVACVFNGTTIRLYINGQLVKSAIVNFTYTAYNYPTVGGDPSYYGNYFSGSIDEVRIWNNERSQSQISYAKDHILVGNEVGLLGYWTFNKVNGSTVADLSGNGHNGTISGATYTTNASPILGWVNLSVDSGVINVGDSIQIDININRHLLSQGTHPFNLIIQSDDPVKPYDTTIITVNAQYDLTPVDIGSDTNLCTGNALVISAGSYASYTWNDNTHNPTLAVISTGTYYVSVTDVNGCTYSDTTQIGLTQSPVANGGLDKSVCQSNSVSLNGSASGGTPPYQYIWKNEVQNIVSNYANYYFTPTTSVMHFLSVIDNNGCESTTADTVNITVNPNPIVNAGMDTTIDLGSSVTLNGSVSGGTYPYTIQWSPNYQMSAGNILNPVLTPTSSSNYNLSITDANNCTGNDNVYVSVKYTITGTVVYNNFSQTPMPNTWVYLENNSGVILDSSLTNNFGIFSFSKVNSGNHYIFAKPNTAFGGVNSTDALGIRRHIVNLATLGGVGLTAADVNKSSTISSADALLVLRRTIGLITSFAPGDWASERISLYVYSSNIQNQTIKVLCMGDVNGSYNIYSTKVTEGSPELKCIPTNTTLIAGETFNLPISVKQSIVPGAITLHLQYPENLIDIIAVSSNGSDIEFSTKNGILSVGAYNEEGMILDNNVLLSIKCRVKSDAPSKGIDISLLNQNEIADIEGNVISGLQLEAPYMNIVDKIDEFKMEDNFPNPFSITSTVRIYVPEDVSVRLSILNTLGVEIKSISTEKLSRGWHELQIDAKEFSQGAYMYRVQAVGLKNTFDQTRRMMIIR